MIIATAKARPFVKWVGGKTQLLPQLLARVPENYTTYYEPFLGGGALFWALAPTQAIISDINAELINAYQVIANDVDALIFSLKQHVYEEAHYYEVRNQDRSRHFWELGEIGRAARFIYLNKCGFNGLYRVNKAGQNNVSFGTYTNPTICDEENLRTCHEVLARPLCIATESNFTGHNLQAGDFVYFDPPYAPLTATANFTGYDAGGFGEREQRTLCGYLKLLDKGGVRWMLSNSSAPLILYLYRDFNLEFVDARRSVNTDATKRGPVKEVIVRNYGGVHG